MPQILDYEMLSDNTDAHIEELAKFLDVGRVLDVLGGITLTACANGEWVAMRGEWISRAPSISTALLPHLKLWLLSVKGEDSPANSRPEKDLRLDR
jgi:hypothetical protein